RKVESCLAVAIQPVERDRLELGYDEERVQAQIQRHPRLPLRREQHAAPRDGQVTAHLVAPGLEQTRQPVDEALRRGRCAAVVVVRDARDEHALADLELVAVAQAYRLRNQLAPDERAVGTAEVGEPQATVAALELRVAA